MSRGGDMAAFNRGLDGRFVEKLNEEYEKKEAGWWSQFVDDKELFLAIRHNAVHVYYRGCRLIEVVRRNGTIVANTHYKYLLRPDMEKYVEVEDGKPRIGDAEAYFADGLSATDLKRSAEPHVRDEKKGVHDILLKNHHVFDIEVEIGGRQIDFAALLSRRSGDARIVFYEAKHFDNKKELRSRDGKVKVIEQIGRYRELLNEHHESIGKSYRRVFKNLCALKGVCRHPELHDLLKETDPFIVEKEPRLVVFGFDDDQKYGSVWGEHKAKLECLLGEGRLILSGNAAGVKIPT